ncbi:MAG: glucose-6-phosphate dehydrogenase [Chitinophagaceae bacterium]|nr:glucose-6-phosphate dehydrogenase [Chitinophagaceae bacterium]
MQLINRPKPTILFIFGGSGDLNYRKLSPALYNLFLDEMMPEQFAIVGLARAPFKEVAYRQRLLDGVKKFSRRKKEISKKWKECAQHISYLQMDVTDSKSYSKISAIIEKYEKEWKTKPVVVYYMAVAPQLVSTIVTHLTKLKLCDDAKFTRVVVEKPFGHDLQSAQALNQLLLGILEEEQIFRIDHFLGKETVQNILAMRFANTLFDPIWNRYYIDHVQITAAEAVGVEGRGAYYDHSGALRDMVQNHMLQLICMVAMEAPVAFDANEIRNKKVDVLNAIRRISNDMVHEMAARGQYASGTLDGKKAAAYRREKEVAPKSNTETFAAVKFYVDNWRWEGVPFYVRTGKYLQRKTTIITLQFRPTPHFAFPPEAADTMRPNRVTISIQPEMDIRIRFQSKRPGQSMILDPVDMVFNYHDAYAGNEPEAYETLLLDVMQGDATLFMRSDQVEAAWKVIQPILDVWEERSTVDFPNYKPGSWGPEDAEALIARDGRNWVTLPSNED